MALVQLVTILLEREQMRLLLRKQTWAFSLYVPLCKLSAKPKVLMGAWKVCVLQLEAKQRKVVCIISS